MLRCNILQCGPDTLRITLAASPSQSLLAAISKTAPAKVLHFLTMGAG